MTGVNEEGRNDGGSEGEFNPNIDPFLSNLVFIVELMATVRPEANITIPVTLTTGSAVITGDISSGRTWWPKFDDALKATWPEQNPSDETADLISEVTANIHRVWQGVYLKSSPRELGQFSYFHLKNARYVTPILVPVPPSDGLVMRVRLEEVHGWSLGKLT